MKVLVWLGVVLAVAAVGAASSPFKDPTHADTLAVYLRQTSFECTGNLFSGILERLTFYYGDLHGTGGKHVSLFGVVELARAVWHILATCLI